VVVEAGVVADLVVEVLEAAVVAASEVSVAGVEVVAEPVGAGSLHYL
jgi:hypothetical protein